MMRKTNILIIVFAVVFTLAFGPAAKESSARSITPGIYHFFGRVLDQGEKPVANCNIILLKNETQVMEEQGVTGEPEQEIQVNQLQEVQTPVTTESVVAITEVDGSYSFILESVASENFYVFFMAEGYRTRSMELNKLMQNRFFGKANKSPIKINVVLEKN